MNNSVFHIPRLVVKLLVLTGIALGLVIWSMGLIKLVEPVAIIVAVVLTPALILLVLYSVYLIVYLVWRLYWIIIGLVAGWLIVTSLLRLLLLGTTTHQIAAAVAIVVGLILWLVMDRWIPGATEKTVVIRHEYERQPSPEPEHPTKPRRPSPPPGRPDPDRINKELAERKRRMGTN